ncbi:MAG: PQQ-binding-like beta-propeller repeat protein, partial [Gemmataceae bacterium]
MSNPFVPPKLDTPPRWPRRVWPGAVVLAVVLAMLLVPPFVIERWSAQYLMMMVTPVIAIAGAMVWWSRLAGVSRADRWAVIACFVIPFGILAGELAVQGIPPMAPAVYGVPFVLALWVGWLVVSVPFGPAVRRPGVFVAILVGWAAVACVRLESTDSHMVPELAWRWTPKPEDAFAVIKGQRQTAETKAGTIEVKPGDWAEFRGPNRDNRLTGVNLDPKRFGQAKELWKVPIGPGWGSFAVVGDRLFTMEQQGGNEAVVCLDADTGKLVWEHTYPAKFTDQNAGVGPRSTPTVSGGRVYSTGATGKLTCLDAATGKEIWTKDYAADADGWRPTTWWGYASAPLVRHGLAIVFTGNGKKGKGTTAFDADTGKVVWQAGKGYHGYSSAQMLTFAGVEQVLMASNYGIEAFDPKTGAVLWEHEWLQAQGNRTAQPAILGDGELLLGTGVGFLASRRLKVMKTDAGWQVQKVWQSVQPSPYYNDGVVHAGHYFGFSGAKFDCIDMADGQEKWSAGTRYGNGQVLLLADQNLLLISQERKSLTDDRVSVFLVEANPEEFVPVAELPTIRGKTWNQPVIAHGRHGRSWPAELARVVRVVDR